jgi:hypothetical protein
VVAVKEIDLPGVPDSVALMAGRPAADLDKSVVMS